MDRIGVAECHSRATLTSSGRIVSFFISRAIHTLSTYRASSHVVSIDCHILALWSWAILPLHGWHLSIRTSPSCTLNFWRLTHGINGIPHSLPNCHENYWDSPISSLTGSWDSPILTRGLWDSPCPFPPFSEGLLFLELSYSLRHRMNFHWSFHLCCSTTVTETTSAVPRIWTCLNVL